MSLFTATVINVMETAIDGTKCTDIEGKEVSANYRITIVDCSSRAMRIKHRKERVQIARFCVLGEADTMIIKMNSEEPRNISEKGVDLCSECSVFIMSNF